MSASFEKSVKSATKIKLAPPKSKWVERILQSTHAGEAGVAEVFRVMQHRLRDSTWTIAFKALIVVHLMIREGRPEVTLSYLSRAPRKMLGVNNYTDVQTQGRNIRQYSNYLIERSKAYANTRVDIVQSEGRLKKLSVDKGLLRETESVQEQIHALLKCDLFADEPENEISLTAFRLITMDLLSLFQAMNEGAINVLEHYFEMSKPDAERALSIYKTFAKQTELVVKYLSVARQYESSTRLEIPKIKHAPTSLSASLEDYLHDKDFETNRRQYIAEKDAKKSSGRAAAPNRFFTDTKSNNTNSKSGAAFPSPKLAQAAPTSKPSSGPPADLIDFFGSIEQHQQPMAQNPAQYQQSMQTPQFPTYQQTGFVAQTGGFPVQQTNASEFPQSNPFGQFQQVPLQQPPQQHLQTINTQSTGAGFGGYTPQPQPTYIQQQTQMQPNLQNDSLFSQFPQQQSHQQQPQLQHFDSNPGIRQEQQATNPFRQSSLPNTFSGFQNTSQSNNFYSTPFTNPNSSTQLLSSPPTMTPVQEQPFQLQSQSVPQIVPQRTGTNPFAKTPTAPTQIPQQNSSPFSNITSQPTGPTNPFRQSTFVNQQTGQGWQHGPQGTMGGLEQLPTVPVFPRPGQTQQQTQQSPWT